LYRAGHDAIAGNAETLLRFRVSAAGF
jgi:hypothetical protein